MPLPFLPGLSAAAAAQSAAPAAMKMKTQNPLTLQLKQLREQSKNEQKECHLRQVQNDISWEFMQKQQKWAKEQLQQQQQHEQQQQQHYQQQLDWSKITSLAILSMNPEPTDSWLSRNFPHAHAYAAAAKAQAAEAAAAAAYARLPQHSVQRT